MKWIACAGLGLLLATAAQRMAPPAAMGTVTGQVMCTDTQRPARFAHVVLINQSSITGSKSPDTRGPNEIGTIWLGTTTGVDGHFVIEHVSPGDYYVVASAKGYVLPIGRLTAAKPPSPEEVGKHIAELMRDVPLIHISADGAAQVSITMQRGGVVAGRVTYDDGSPVAGVNVRVEMAEGMDRVYQMPFYLFAALQISERDQTITDDDGYYRISGIQPGKYVVKSTVLLRAMFGDVGTMTTSHSVNQLPSTLETFYPHTFQRSGAKTISIVGTERLTGTDITVNIDSLRSVRGRIHTEDGNHVPDRAYLRLADPDGNSRFVPIKADGSYEFDMVPPGTYKLMVDDAADVNDPANAYDIQDKNLKVTKEYDADEYDVMVVDKDVVMEDVLLDEVKPEDETVKPK